MRKVFTNGHIVLPDRVAEDISLVVEGDRIVSADYIGSTDGMEVVDLNGGWLLAGFVDMHLHGGDGSDFMDGRVEDFQKACRIHCAHGTTSLCPTATACSKEELFDLFDTCREAVAKGGLGADILGLHLEGPYLSMQFKGAQPAHLIRNPDPAEVDEILKKADGLIVRWSGAPELEGMEAFAKKMKENGILCAIAHSAAVAEEVIESHKWGFSLVTHAYNSTTFVHKVGQIVHGGIVEASILLDEMDLELIGDGCHIPKEVMWTALKIKGPERVALITDAMRAAGQNVTTSFLGNPNDNNPVIIEGGVAKLPDRSFYAGSIATADRCYRNAVNVCQLSPVVVSKMMSATPARILGRDAELGSLEAGKRADLVVMDTELQVRQVYVKGRLVSES